MTLLWSLSFLGSWSQHVGRLLLRRFVSLHPLRSLLFVFCSLFIFGFRWWFSLLRLGLSLSRSFQLLLIGRVLSLWSWCFLLFAFWQILTSRRLGRWKLFLRLYRRRLIFGLGRRWLFLSLGWRWIFCNFESFGFLQLSSDFSWSNLSIIIASSFGGSNFSLLLLNERHLLLGFRWLCLLLVKFGPGWFWRWWRRLLCFGFLLFRWRQLSLIDLGLAWFGWW